MSERLSGRWLPRSLQPVPARRPGSDTGAHPRTVEQFVRVGDVDEGLPLAHAGVHPDHDLTTVSGTRSQTSAGHLDNHILSTV